MQELNELENDERAPWDLVNVGIFDLPGVEINKAVMSEEDIEEMEQWSQSCNCGTVLKTESSVLWYFFNEDERNLFIITWSK